MLTIRRYPESPRLQLPRRDFLQIGLLGPLGLALPTLQHAQAASRIQDSAGFGRAKQCILVFLNGGPSQLDMWDMKPEAPAEVRGELKPIATNVPGIRIGELLPRTAKEVDKFKIVRSVSHVAGVHTTAMYTMLTGTNHPTPNVDQTRVTAHDHPHLGAIVGKWRGWDNRLPPFASLPALFRAEPVQGIWPGQSAGFLGRKYDPFVVEGDKRTCRFGPPELALPVGVSPERLAARRALGDFLDSSFQVGAAFHQQTGGEVFREQAFSLLGSSRLAQACDLTREPERSRERYGHHLFGQGLLLARRLVEAGISLITVYWIDPTPAGAGGGEYDSHGRIYWHMRNRLVPPTDRGLSALFADLAARGLLEQTLVVVMGEFGRTPRLNSGAGRDHWPDVQSILLAGAGITGGAVEGASDKIGAYPATTPVTPPDLGQTILHLLGVPADLHLEGPEGQPLPASRGKVLHWLIS